MKIFLTQNLQATILRLKSSLAGVVRYVTAVELLTKVGLRLNLNMLTL